MKQWKNFFPISHMVIILKFNGCDITSHIILVLIIIPIRKKIKSTLTDSKLSYIISQGYHLKN